jgi:hypothetical protein
MSVALTQDMIGHGLTHFKGGRGRWGCLADINQGAVRRKFHSLQPFTRRFDRRRD